MQVKKKINKKKNIELLLPNNINNINNNDENKYKNI